MLPFAGCSSSAPVAARGTDGASDGGSVRVQLRPFRRTVRLSGTVEAVQSRIVATPRLSGQSTPTLVITRLIANGAKVRPGEVLVEFDRQTQMQTVLDREAEYQGLLEQIKRKQADQSASLARDETELKTAEYDLQAARVDMRKNEVVSSLEAERNRQNLAEAEARLAQLKETFTLKREAAAAELRILEIQRDRARNAMVYAQNNIEKMTIRSPLEGLAVLTPIFKMSRMAVPQQGDEVRPGSPILQVVNPAAMLVRARVNQVDFFHLQSGQPAEILLDAYPDMVFPGRVENLGAIAATSDYSKQVRYFSVQIAIEGNDPKLLPDLSAAADVELESLGDALLLPRESVIDQEGESMVEVLLQGRAERRRVKIGPMNDSDVVILSGLKEGDEVSRRPQSTPGAGPRTPE